MAKQIEPFNYQKRTNIEEHNQLVDKVNEIVNVINDVNLDTINTDIDNLETRADKTDSDLASVQAKDIIQDSEIADLKPRVAMTETEITNLKPRVAMTETEITNLKPRVAMTETEITNLKPRVAMTETEITNLKTRADKTDSDLATVQAKDITQDSEIDGITKSLVSDVIMSDGTTMGSVQVSIEREDGALITSKNYKWGRDIGIRLEAGTQAGYVKAVIDLSDGTVLESNEYRIVEVMESDIYVTAITLVADQNAGTLGGNITYSNGTTQTINTVSVPTAPGVTSALESLQSRMTDVEQKNTSQDGQITALDSRMSAVEQKNTSQDGQISALDSRLLAVEQKNTSQDGEITALDTRVKAIEDTPGVGQFDTGKLGTIAGSTADGRIKAENDGTGSVNGWSTLKDRVTATEGQIVTAQNDITDLDGLVARKVEIMQGTENAGKVLGIGSDGNVSPIETSSGGEVWEEVDLRNWPSNWVEGDRVKFISKVSATFPTPSPNSWTSQVTTPTIITTDNSAYSPVIELSLSSAQKNLNYEINSQSYTAGILSVRLASLFPNTGWNSNNIFSFTALFFNGAGYKTSTKFIDKSNISSYITKMWRLKKA